MIQKKILWGEPEQSLREAQRMLKYQQNLKAEAQVRAAAVTPAQWAADLPLPYSLSDS